MGSSNFSFSALKTGFEWNLAMNAQAEPYTFQNAMEKFMQSFYNETTLPVNPDSIHLYEQEYLQYHQKNPELISRITEMEEAEIRNDMQEEPMEEESEGSLVPITPRPAQEAALEALKRTLDEQYDKAMVVMATGLGKTYLAGFLAQRFKRVLFIAHREGFVEDDFDLIIVDEFHHAAGSIPIYIGVFDETDYTKIRWLGSRYDDEQLLLTQLKESQAEKIYEVWDRHKQTRTIGFCSSIQQADYLAAYFRSQGVSVLSLHSRTTEMSRGDAIQALESRELEVVFTVDLFNEGTDIPSVDTLLFVRPTESLTVFTQQVGRGLRLADGKSHCVIIDLIGNYRNADVKLRLFAEPNEEGGKGKREDIIPTLPLNCEIQLDIQVINLLQELTRKRLPHREKLHHEFVSLKQELGRIPTYLKLHLHGNSNSQQYRNEFGSYFGFLHWAELLSESESDIYIRYEAWIRDVEKTVMTKSYKMIVLLYMLERGEVRWPDPVASDEIAGFFHRYLTEKEYRRRIDFADKDSRKLWEWNEVTASKIAQLIALMPMTKWSGAKGSMTRFEDGLF